MSRRYKFQVGGEEDFFSQIADYISQQQQDNYDQPETPQQDVAPEDNTSDEPNQDYEELSRKYQELEDRVNSLASQTSNDMPNDYGDNFLNFLFGDDNKLPIDFDNISRESPEEDTKPGVPASKISSYKSRGFKTFSSYEEGRAALEHQLELYKTGKTRQPIKPNSTLYQTMSIYAPASDKNNPQQYAKFIADKLGISIDTPISNVDTKKWADAIEQMEGNKVGHNPGNLKYQFGGTPVADTPDELYEGLNNPYYAQYGEMILDLPNQYNMIRGLDNGQPVHVKDGYGNYATLKGNKDTAYFKGSVHEEI